MPTRSYDTPAVLATDKVRCQSKKVTFVVAFTGSYGASFMDVECPSWGLGETVTVGSPCAVVDAVLDALKPYGVRHADMPLTPAAVWSAMRGRPIRTDLAIP